MLIKFWEDLVGITHLRKDNRTLSEQWEIERETAKLLAKDLFAYKRKGIVISGVDGDSTYSSYRLSVMNGVRPGVCIIAGLDE